MPGQVGGPATGTDWGSVHGDFVAMQNQSAQLGAKIASLQNQLQTDTLTQSQYANLLSAIGNLEQSKASSDQQLSALAQLLSTLDPSSPKLTSAQADMLLNTNIPHLIAANPWLQANPLVAVISYIQQFMKTEAQYEAMEARNVAKLETSTMTLAKEESQVDQQQAQNALISGLSQAGMDLLSAGMQAHSLYKRSKMTEPTDASFQQQKAAHGKATQENNEEIENLQKNNKIQQKLLEGYNREDAEQIVNADEGDGPVGGHIALQPAAMVDPDVAVAASAKIKSNDEKIAKLKSKQTTLNTRYQSDKSRAMIKESELISDKNRVITQVFNAGNNVIKALCDCYDKQLEGEKALIHGEQSVTGQALSSASQAASSAQSAVEKGADLITSISSAHHQAFKLGNA